MINLKIMYQPFTKTFELGYHASYHGETVRTMVRQWVVMITNGVTMVTSTEANCTRHGSVHQGNHYYAWYCSLSVNCKLRSKICLTACGCMQYKTSTSIHTITFNWLLMYIGTDLVKFTVTTNTTPSCSAVPTLGVASDAGMR